MPESATDAESGALMLLQACEGSDHCKALNAYAVGNVDAESLSYEDVFYPLRHHAGELAHRVDGEAFSYWIRWGSGDFLYAISLRDGRHSDEFQIESPGNAYDLCVGEGFTPVLLEHTPFGEGDDG